VGHETHNTGYETEAARLGLLDTLSAEDSGFSSVRVMLAPSAVARPSAAAPLKLLRVLL